MHIELMQELVACRSGVSNGFNQLIHEPIFVFGSVQRIRKEVETLRSDVDCWVEEVRSPKNIHRFELIAGLVSRILLESFCCPVWGKAVLGEKNKRGKEINDSVMFYRSLLWFLVISLYLWMFKNQIKGEKRNRVAYNTPLSDGVAISSRYRCIPSDPKMIILNVGLTRKTQGECVEKSKSE